MSQDNRDHSQTPFADAIARAVTPQVTPQVNPPEGAHQAPTSASQAAPAPMALPPGWQPTQVPGWGVDPAGQLRQIPQQQPAPPQWTPPHTWAPPQQAPQQQFAPQQAPQQQFAPQQWAPPQQPPQQFAPPQQPQQAPQQWTPPQQVLTVQGPAGQPAQVVPAPGAQPSHLVARQPMPGVQPMLMHQLLSLTSNEGLPPLPAGWVPAPAPGFAINPANGMAVPWPTQPLYSVDAIAGTPPNAAPAHGQAAPAGAVVPEQPAAAASATSAHMPTPEPAKKRGRKPKAEESIAGTLAPAGTTLGTVTTAPGDTMLDASATLGAGLTAAIDQTPTTRALALSAAVALETLAAALREGAKG